VRRRRRRATTRQLELIAAEVAAGRADVLIGVCYDCGHWFDVADIGEPCSLGRVHAVNYYELVGVRRPTHGRGAK
jgi:hypothetical protein